MSIGIYSITSPSGRVYIGSSANIEVRWRHHRNALARGAHTNQLLQRTYDKYGAECFVFAVVELCARENLITREQYHIDACPRSLNLVRHVVAPMRGRSPSAATRAKMSAAAMGRKLSEATRAKMRGRRPPTPAVLAEIKRKAALRKGAPRNDVPLSKSGYRGVYQQGAKWVAYAGIGAARQRVGTFETADSAFAMRLVWLSAETQ